MEELLQKHIDAYKAKLGITDEHFIRPEGWRQIALAFGNEIAINDAEQRKSIEWLQKELNATRRELSAAHESIDVWTGETNFKGDGITDTLVESWRNPNFTHDSNPENDKG